MDLSSSNGSVDQPSDEKKGDKEECKVYKVRWVVLGLFVLFSASNASQWIQYSIIADIIMKYYGVSAMAVNWTSMIYMVLYIPFVFPASFILDKLGLRKTILIGAALNCFGTWIKVGSVDPDRFYVAFIGHSIVAFAQIFVLSVPARLAAVWFGPKQVSSACSIGVFGNQLGCAIGFLVPGMIVQDGKMEDIATGLYILHFTFVGVTTAILILITLFFKDQPPTPPSQAEANKTSSEAANVSFLQSIKNMMLNRNYFLLLISYGINVGIYYAISTLLNQIILTHYPDGSQDAGRIGLVLVLAGMLGSVACGVVLDRYRKYKETTLVVYVFSLIGMVLYTFTISTSMVVVYFVGAFLGFFMTGLLPVGFELGAELTYPEPEGTSAGLLNASAQIFGVVFTNVYSVLFDFYGDKWANIAMAIMLLVGTFMTAFIQSDLRRQAAK